MLFQSGASAISARMRHCVSRRWLRVKVSGQGPPKPSPAAEAQRSVSRALPLTSARMRHCVSRRWLQLNLGLSRDLGEPQVFSQAPGPKSKSREATDPCEKATTHMSKQATHMRSPDPYEKAADPCEKRGDPYEKAGDPYEKAGD